MSTAKRKAIFRLPTLAADLVHSRVAVIVAIGGIAPAKAAKAATGTIPIVFSSGGDPVKTGLVKSLNRPGGNITGVSIIFSELPAKLLGLLHQLVPSAALIGALVNSRYPDVDLQVRELQEAAEAIKQPIRIERAGTEPTIEAAFATFAETRVAAVLVANDPFLGTRRHQIIALAAKHSLPAIYFLRDFVEDGGL